jgi:hypothetical protein
LRWLSFRTLALALTVSPMQDAEMRMLDAEMVEAILAG